MSNESKSPGANDEIHWLSAGELLGHYRKHELSPVEVTRRVLERAERTQSSLNAFVLIDAEAALQAASASEQRWLHNQPQGLLDGVPVSVKDIVITRGWPTLRGSLTIDREQPWLEDAPAVARLREHGAVLFGKTTTPEFAVGAFTHCPLTGITRNPWNTARTPGGSSGGAGAAIASGIGPLAVGTDAGGSIRVPSSFCGIFGFKPGGGRVPAYPPTPYGTLASIGPMSRTVEDAALMLSVISEPDLRDWGALPYDALPYQERLARDFTGLRVAWSPTLGYARVDPEVVAICERAVATFGELGASVEEVDHVFDDPTSLMDGFRSALTHFAFQSFDEDRLSLMDERVRALIRRSRAVTSVTDHLRAQAQRAAFGAHMNVFHQTYDLLLTPTVAAQPFAAGATHPDGYPDSTAWYPFTPPFNFTRQPAASVPCGFTRSGMPVGLQIVGPSHADLLVLQAAHGFERVQPWRQSKPAQA